MSIDYYAQVIQDLHANWTPHPGQIEVGKVILNKVVQQIFLECGRNWGKALALDTPVATPGGFRAIGDIQSGDLVLGANGLPCTVTKAHEVLFGRKCFEIEFVNGEKITSCEDHLWEVSTQSDRKRKKKPRVIKTKDFLNKTTFCGEYNFHIRRTKPVAYQHQDLPIDPWLLGVWLGNGNTYDSRVSTADPELIDRIHALGFETTRIGTYDHYIKKLGKTLREVGLKQNKHIPKKYLLGSIHQRLELLHGLMDTDGHCEKTGLVTFSQSNEQMARDVFELVASLGERPTLTSRIPKIGSVQHKRSWNVNWTPINFIPFWLNRKKKHLRPFSSRSRSHAIKNIKEVKSVPVRCLTVDSDDSLFLVSKSFIPTHNTEFMCYMFWRTALLNPGSENYYFAPLQNQGREIIWIPGRIKTFGPQDYIEGINDTEMRITFKNGSFIKVDGSDNIDKYRGIKIVNGGLVGFDEYKDFRPDFYGVFDPNILDGSLIIVGTPPEAESHFTKDADEFATNPKKRHFNMPSETNPHLSREWLANKKAELYAKGDGVIWEREYMAKRVKGGKASILPQAHSVELKSQREMLRSIARDSKRLQWFCIADPGTATCFAVMFLALNPNTKRIHVFETIYERDPTQTGVTQIGPRIIETKNRLAPNSEWTYVCDEAALWFIKEMFDNHAISFNQTTKSTNDKEGQIGMMKDIMLMGLLEIAGRPGMEKDLKSDDLQFAEAFLWEMQNYIKDKHGKIPKKEDHLIDDFRYFLSEALYELPGKAEAQKASQEDRRGYTIEEEFETQLDGDLEVY